MTTLHMEVEAAMTTQRKMAETHAQLMGLVQNMSSSVGSLQPSWLGNSATEFFAMYEQWRTSSTQLLESLEVMSTRLQTEIQEWETMASKLA